jgi:PAS domain S-box-containing protein
MDEHEKSKPSQSVLSFLEKAWVHAPDGLRILDRNGVMLDVNDSFCRIAKKSRPELIGKPFYYIYAERLREEMGQRQRESFTHRTIAEHSEQEYELWNGTKVWLDIGNIFSEDEHSDAVLFSYFKDVTEKKKAEETARIATERYQFIFENIETVYFETGLDGAILALSPSIEKYSGCRRAELIGQPIMRFYKDESLRSKFLETLRADGIVTHFEITFRKAGGADVPAAVNAQMLFGDDGRPVKICGFISDLTEQKVAESTLLEQEERFHAVIDHSSDIVLIIDPTGIIVYETLSASKILGYPPGFLKGKSPFVFIHPDDHDVVRAGLDRLISDSVTGKPTEYRMLRRDGTVGFFESFGTNLIENPHVRGIVVNMHEITERKRNEQKIREQTVLWESLAKFLPFELWVRDRDDRVIFQNQASIEHWGQQYGKTIGEQEGTEELSAIWRENNRRALSGEVAVGEVSYPIGDVVKHFHQIVAPLRDGSSISGTVGMNIDVTEQKVLELQLLQAQKLEGLGTLAGGIAHDFNNLLSMILGSAELLRIHAKGNEKIQKHVERIIDSSERGASISRQLLLFSRPEQVKLEPLSVSHIILQVQEMLRHFLPKDIVITTHIDIENGMIMGESGHIHQALLNLAINARDAMPAGGHLHIDASSMSGKELGRYQSGINADEYVLIKVSDTGIGMDEETLQKIYNPFFTTKDPGKGTGLGLAIVHGIVKSHHGVLRVESEVGNGTSFTICIPAIDRKTQPVPQRMEYHGAAKETVLIVDDEDLIREVLYDTLESAGYTVLAAEDGAEGLRMYNQFMNTIALVITDIGMPKMSGSTFIKKLKEINPDVKVIVSSGFMDSSAREQMGNLGVDAILTKPYKFATIHATVRKVLQI